MIMALFIENIIAFEAIGALLMPVFIFIFVCLIGMSSK